MNKGKQFGYWYIGRGLYLTKDPIGYLLSKTWLFFHRRNCKSIKIFNDCPHHNVWKHNWDNFYRVKLRIPYII